MDFYFHPHSKIKTPTNQKLWSKKPAKPSNNTDFTAEWKYTAPGGSETYTVEFAWTDSFYIFHVKAVDTTNFVGERSNVDTVFVPQ